MPSTKKKVAGKSGSRLSPKASVRSAESPERVLQGRTPAPARARGGPGRTAQRRRGWRDIEALSERARLKKMLVDIWHEDIELDEDIFGEKDQGSVYYADNRSVEVEVEPAAEEEFEDFEDFEEED